MVGLRSLGSLTCQSETPKPSQPTARPKPSQPTARRPQTAREDASPPSLLRRARRTPHA